MLLLAFSGKGCVDGQKRLKGGSQSCADMLSPQGGAREPGRPDLNIVHSPQDRLRRRAQHSQVTSALFEHTGWPKYNTVPFDCMFPPLSPEKPSQALWGISWEINENVWNKPATAGKMAFTLQWKRKPFQSDQMDEIDEMCETRHNRSPGFCSLQTHSTFPWTLLPWTQSEKLKRCHLFGLLLLHLRQQQPFVTDTTAVEERLWQQKCIFQSTEHWHV